MLQYSRKEKNESLSIVSKKRDMESNASGRTSCPLGRTYLPLSVTEVERSNNVNLMRTVSLWFRRREPWMRERIEVVSC
jgi:hypothetical protein